ncbi:hypothetical protein DLAC_01183 [Tieghemostelium lacteum]|uniref:Uncharacterized protein n=1 Tax=Tieghemostelium lacteum TaxID=361077 RepID=A0A152A7Z1_TIELA|nr:hypothetical protein DLAC_01183 [Tieghemostelium lacteum]|eukprot:KYR02352.1 hypothetical protein DLAC_01183 [Tieghemostelium lacteum]
MNTPSLPYYIIQLIIKEIWYCSYTPFKYKLTLALINKNLFNYISSNLATRLEKNFPLTSKYVEICANHLDTSLCLLKNIRELVCVNTHETTHCNQNILFRVTEHVESLKILYQQRDDNVFSITSSQFPNLKKCEIYIIGKFNTSFIDQFPMVECLVLRISHPNQSLIELLKRIEPTVKQLSIEFNTVDSCFNNILNPSELSEYLSTYKTNQLETCFVYSSIGIQSYSMLMNQTQSLTSLNTRNHVQIEQAFHLIQECHQLKSLKCSITTTGEMKTLMNLINCNPNLTQLNLYLVISQVEKQYEIYQLYFKYIEDLSATGNIEILIPYFQTDINRNQLKILSLDNPEFGYHSKNNNLYPAFIQYLQNNHSLTELNISVKFYNNGDSDHYEQLSMILYKHPSLKILCLNTYKGHPNILKYLDKSETLQFITLEILSMFTRSEEPLKDTDIAMIKYPFKLYTTNGICRYYRNGINFEPLSAKSKLISYFRKKFNNLYNYWSQK